MELSELLDYAGEKYRIEEEYLWSEEPGFSVLRCPGSRKWAALLLRRWDSECGEMRMSCDIRCGRESFALYPRRYITPSLQMGGRDWLNVRFCAETEPTVVFALFDRAVERVRTRSPGAVLDKLAGRTLAWAEEKGYTIEFDVRLDTPDGSYHETALPFAGSGYRPPREDVPEKLREMRRLYVYGLDTPALKARNFYRQAVFMRDYEDDLPWTGEFNCYYPCYHDMNTRQLRGYFTWRAALRRGEAQPIPISAAYLYVYELLNGVGADTPAACLERLRDFERLYLESGFGDARMRANLRRWMLEFAVLNELPPALARDCADPDLMARDEALAALREPDAQPDEAVFAALAFFGGEKLAASPVLAQDAARGRALFAACWREACAYTAGGRPLFALCFGERKSRPWYPLSGAVYFERERPGKRDYTLNESRSYHCRGGVWTMEGCERKSFDKALLQGFLHEAEVRLRRYTKAGRALRENPADAWATPYIDAAIRADIEAARPKLTLDLGGLEQIRRDAAATRESLLTEEERAGEPEAAPMAAETPLDEAQLALLRALLDGGDAGAILRERHILPAVAADGINEALFDELGDTAVLCENGKLLLVDEYTDELREILGGSTHG